MTCFCAQLRRTHVRTDRQTDRQTDRRSAGPQTDRHTKNEGRRRRRIDFACSIAAWLLSNCIHRQSPTSCTSIHTYMTRDRALDTVESKIQPQSRDFGNFVVHILDPNLFNLFIPVYMSAELEVQNFPKFVYRNFWSRPKDGGFFILVI